MQNGSFFPAELIKTLDSSNGKKIPPAGIDKSLIWVRAKYIEQRVDKIYQR
jgi:hypothetical protein